jgi:hypothetical protein
MKEIIIIGLRLILAFVLMATIALAHEPKLEYVRDCWVKNQEQRESFPSIILFSHQRFSSVDLDNGGILWTGIL